jgi:Acetyltransferase (GNAT) domain
VGGGQLRIERLGEPGLEEWANLVGSSPEGSVYSLPRYLDALCDAAGGRFVILGAKQGDELVGGVALYENDSRHGPYVAPRPLLYYNGPVLRPGRSRYPSERTAWDRKTLSALEREVGARHYARVTFACSPSFRDVRPFLNAGWSAAPQYTYVLDASDPAGQWSRVEQNLRRLVRRCEREGVRLSTDDDIETFVHLHVRTMARKGRDPYLPPAGFRSFFTALRAAGLGRLFHAQSSDGTILASQLVLVGPGGRCHMAAAATDGAAQGSGASAFLRWKALEAIGAAGGASVDLTDATLNSVTHFKSQLGGELRMLLVLDAPRSLSYRLGGAARRALARARTAVTATVHREVPS